MTHYDGLEWPSGSAVKVARENRKRLEASEMNDVEKAAKEFVEKYPAKIAKILASDAPTGVEGGEAK